MQANTPRVGNWYKDLAGGAIFEVVAIDENQATIETQLLDGEITEFDMDNWEELNVEMVEEPEDWRAGYSLGEEDSKFADDTFTPETWGDPLDRIEPETINGLIDEF